ncbi:MAG: pyruvate ferredoxin oxidoreductase, partial [Crenarchaeota archaeon]|nr:pyruvate ferredoxin oxidoreductase [Thermoproteota archaeon]
DAEIAVVVIGSTAGTLKEIVDQLREEGIKAGVLRIRSFRPFPAEDIREALKNTKSVAVMDKSISPGSLGAAVYNEVRNALYDLKQRPVIVNYIYGLGGRDYSPRELRRIFEGLMRIARTGKMEKQINYLGLRE